MVSSGISKLVSCLIVAQRHIHQVLIVLFKKTVMYIASFESTSMNKYSSCEKQTK